MNGPYSEIDSVESDLPTLETSLRLQETASAAGLDWPEAADVWSRINEELAEAKAASEDLSILGSRIAARATENTECYSTENDSAHDLLVDELGELLFAVVDVCRILGVHPDQALRRANSIFRCCFKQIEQQAGKEGRMIALEHPALLKRIWDQTKRAQREKNAAPNIIWKGVGRSAGRPAENENQTKAIRA